MSQHLRVLRESGFLTVRPDGRAAAVLRWTGRVCSDVDEWIEPFRRFWTPPLDALATELARGNRERRRATTATAATEPRSSS